MGNEPDEKLVALLEELNGADLESVYRSFAEKLKEFNALPADDGLEDDDVPEDPPKPSTPSQPLTSVPPLPPGTVLDLSQPTVRAPNVPDFTIPSMLSVRADGNAVTNPTSLETGDWLIIANNNRLLYAYTMGTISGSSDPSRQALKAALDWKVPDTTDFLEPRVQEADIKSETTYTAESASYVEAGFDKQQASASFPFAAASFEREHKARQAGASEHKKLLVIGRWFFPRVLLKLRHCTVLSARFTKAVEEAIGKAESTGDIRALQKVFEEYGTAVPGEILLGGQLTLTHTEVSSGTVNENEVENTVRAAVSIKTSKASGSVGAAYSNAKGEKVTAEHLSRSIQFKVQGGDTTLASNPVEWPSTVKKPSHWAVIGRGELVSILEWLPEDLRKRVLVQWPKVALLPAIREQVYLTPGPSLIGKAEQGQFLIGIRTANDAAEGSRGHVQIACGADISPELGRGSAVGGAASMHRYRRGDIWIESTAICVPVPQGAQFSVRAIDGAGRASTNVVAVETNLNFGQWRYVDVFRGGVGAATTHSFVADGDGFIFCSLVADDNGARGYVTCSVNGTVLAAASVHVYDRSDCHIRYASCCVPYAKGSRVEIRAEGTSGKIGVAPWQIPVSPAWRFTPPQRLQLGEKLLAPTDGFLNGVVMVEENGPRGVLRLYSFKELPASNIAPNMYPPMAAVAVHKYTQSDRWISHASGMVPAGKGSTVWADLEATAGRPPAEVYWTGIKPATDPV